MVMVIITVVKKVVKLIRVVWVVIIIVEQGVTKVKIIRELKFRVS